MTRKSRATALSIIAGLVTAMPCCLPGAAEAAAPEWTTYHHDASRSGIDPTGSSPVTPTHAWQSDAQLDGEIYGEPLVYGSRVYAATENDTVYALNAFTGEVLWRAHVGTAVPSSELNSNGSECVDINPQVGITSTPVIDPARNAIYAVTNTWDGSDRSSIRHELVALDLETGAMLPHFPLPVDPAYPAHGGAKAPERGGAYEQLQRPALALDNGSVIVGFGSYEDCPTYWGWLVAAPEDGVGPLRSYQVDSGPGHEAGSLWGAGNGPYVDAAGDVYVASANGESGGEYDHGDSVLRLTSGLELLESWAPENWAQLDEEDLDIASSEPLPLPGGLLFQIGKQGTAYLLRAGALGHGPAPPAAQLQVCEQGSFGGGLYVPASAEEGTLYVTCNEGLRALSVNTSAPSMVLKPGWVVPGKAVGPPIYAAGLVWVTSWRTETRPLFALDPASGEVKARDQTAPFMHFSTPSAGGGRLFFADSTSVGALTIAGEPAPSMTATAVSSSPNPSSVGQTVTITARVSPVPDAGEVIFTDGDSAIASCGSLTVNVASRGEAACQVPAKEAGSHQIRALYSGDPYYSASASPPFEQAVEAPASLLAAPPGSGSVALVISSARQSHAVWRERGARSHRGHRGHRPPTGTTFSFVLSRAATVELTFTQRLAGHESGGRCRPGGGRGSAHRRCHRTVTAGVLRFNGRSATNTIAFRGRLSASRKLRAGHYTLVITATGADGQRSSAKPLRFTILK